MDPYLEQPAFWSSFHARLVVAIADALSPRLLPTYYIEVETRTYTEDSESELFIGIPDAVIYKSTQPHSPLKNRTPEPGNVALQDRPQRVQLPTGIEIRERYLEVRELGTDAVITVIELLSPKNKRTGKGRAAYEEKRQRILDSASHFVELDFLRGDAPMPMVGVNAPWDYRILVSRSEQRPSAELYGFTVQESFPLFPLPLKTDDASPAVELQTIFDGLYDRAGYGLRLNYSQPVPPPALSLTQQQWVSQLLAPLQQA